MGNQSPFRKWGSFFFSHIDIIWPINIVRNSDLVVIQGWNKFTYIYLMVVSMIARKPFYLRSDNNSYSQYKIQSFAQRIRTKLKDIFISPFLKQCSGVLTIGSRNEEYFSNLGILKQRFHRVPFSVDTNLFQLESDEREKLRFEFLKNHNFDKSTLIYLFVGKVRKDKGVFDLIEAARSFPKDIFLFAGDGPELAELKAKGGDLPNVVILGFKNQSELPIIYAIANFIVLPSHREAWGLVINEGVAAGCIPIVSEACGCAPELVETTSGLLFQEDNVDSLIQAIKRSKSITLDKGIFLKLATTNSFHTVGMSVEKFVNLIGQSDKSK
jgi:glycosyltransferase involved in cell wall biosynthesis